MFDISMMEVRRSGEVVLFDASPALWTARLAGALAGSLISIAYVLPKGRREAFLRLAVGVTTGVVFGGTAGVKLFDTLGLLEKISVIEMTLVGAAVCSLCAWWGLGLLRRIGDNWAERKFNRSWSHRPSVENRKKEGDA